MEEKFIQERLKHENSESLMFDKILELQEQYNKLVQQNQELQANIRLKNNQIKALEEGFDNSIRLNEGLRKEIKLKDKMTELMADLLHVFDLCSAIEDIDCVNDKVGCEVCLINYFKQQAIKELEVSK